MARLNGQMKDILADEELLLRLESVKSRDLKGTAPGALSLTNIGVRWIDSDGKLQTTISYDKIKSQKISPESKPKVQLQLCLEDGKTNTFQFVDFEGQKKQLADRDSVKELVQQMIQRVKSKPEPKPEEKTTSEDPTAVNLDGAVATPPPNGTAPLSVNRLKEKILKENKELFDLYRQLVTTKLVTADEFWDTFAKEDLKQSKSAEQQIGVPPGFLSDLTQADGCNGLKLNLTADVIQAIFKTYPSVKAKHLAKVPHELSEKQFWTEFFQSHYFHRDRVINPNPKELFADCIRQDDIDMITRNSSVANKKEIDLAQLDDNYSMTLDEEEDGPRSNAAHAVLLRRFNHHSDRILRACLGEDDPSTSGVGSALPQTSTREEPPVKRRRVGFDEETELLRPDDDSNAQLAHLTLKDPTRYRETLSGVEMGKEHSKSFDAQEATDCIAAVKNAMQSTHTQGVDFAVCLRVLKDLTPGGRLIPAQAPDFNDLITKDLLESIRSAYVASTELLRHFWMCFPPSNAQLQQKAEKMMETLKKFETSTILPLKKQLHKLNISESYLAHLCQMLAAAQEKFESWKSKKKR